MHINVNRAGQLVTWITVIVYVLGDYLDVEPMRLAGAILAVVQVAGFAVLFCIGFGLGWRHNRQDRRDVKARVDRLNQGGW